PGNLLFFDGMLVSQTATSIAAYPLLETALKQIDKLLEKNAKDPEALLRRGDLRLDRGDLKGASDDYRAALKNEPPKGIQARLRERLFETLVELCQKDFAAVEPVLKEFEELTRPIPVILEGVSPEERAKLAAEQVRRR